MSSNFLNTCGSVNSTKIIHTKMVSGTPLTFRVVGNVLRRYQYWLKNPQGKSMPFENLGFNRTTEKFDSGVDDPVRSLGITELNSYTKTVGPIKSKRAYAVMILNRATGQYECLDLKKDLFDGMIGYLRDMEIDKVEDVEFVAQKTGTTFTDTKYSLNIILTQKANKDQEAVAALHAADEEVLAKAKPIEELFPLETPEVQKKRLQTFLAAAPEAPEGEPDGEGVDDLDGLDD